MHDTFRDVVVLVRDTGMRNKKEHPELEQVRRVLNGTNSHYNLEQGL